MKKTLTVLQMFLHIQIEQKRREKKNQAHLTSQENGTKRSRETQFFWDQVFLLSM